MYKKSKYNWTAAFKEDELFIKKWVEEGSPIPKIGIFVVTYNHVNFLAKTLKRIPSLILDIVEEIFVFDDASKDDTYLVAEGFKKVYGMEKLTIHRQPQNLGYGGNQKAGYIYAIEKGLDYVILLHGDGQYAPEALPCVIRLILEKEAKVVFGSRMMIPGEARQGGMPLYKYIGNKILTAYENLFLGSNLTEYHSGYRLYSTEILKKIPFTLNSNDFHFDTEIIIQIRELGEKIYEVPVPSYYGDEICYVNGIKYAWNIFWTVIYYKLYQWGLREDSRFKITSFMPSYQLKTHPLSSHMQIVKLVPYDKHVLDIGCGYGTILPFLIEKNCQVVGIDTLPPEEVDKRFSRYICCNLESMSKIPYPEDSFDVVILADVLEHIRNPQKLLSEVRRVVKSDGIVIASTGNIALFLYRILLFLGLFPYSKKGILDETHVHLYTFKTFYQLMQQAGFKIIKVKTTPIPFELVLGEKVGRVLTYLYYPLTKLRKTLFAYQFILICQKENLFIPIKEK